MLPENKKCPCCGGKMAEGYMLGGYNHHLYWVAKGRSPGTWEKLRTFWPFTKSGSVDKSMVLDSARFDCDKFPALNCPECQVIILDYDENNTIE